jgi:hypothetical protein
VTYLDPVFLMFGKETAGLPEELLRASHGRFCGLQKVGKPTKFSWEDVVCDTQSNMSMRKNP